MLRRLWILLGALALLGGGRYGWWVLVEHRFRVITEGELYQSGAIPPESLPEVLRERAIHTVIDLRNPTDGDLPSERAAVEAAGVRYVSLPTPQVPSTETVEAFLRLMASPDVRPALVHCKDGYGRSVLFAALYRVEFEGWDPETARRATSLWTWTGNFAPDSPKGTYLREYKHSLPESSSASDPKNPTAEVALGSP